MSGALSGLSSFTSGGLVSSLLGLTRTAAWRGVQFDVLDGKHSAGRRWVQFLFPGRPDTLQEDLGAMDGPIEINGLLIGDDWLRRQKRFEAACKAPGPGTLVHPWLGEIKVILIGPAEFGFDHQRQLVCSVTLRFQVWQERKPAVATTLGGLLDTIDTAIEGAQAYVAAIVAPLGDALGLISLAQSVLGRVGAVYDSLLGTSAYGTGRDSTGGLALAAAASLDAVTGGVALVAGANLAAQSTALLAAVPAALALAADSAADPAIGPGPLEAAHAPAADPIVTAQVMLAALPMLQPAAGDQPVATALLQAARVQAVAAAVSAASCAAWDSRDQAVIWRGAVDTALAGVQAELAAAGAGPAWRALRDVRTAWARDMTEAIGRLLPVQHIGIGAPVSAWQVALAAAGDTPSQIRPALLDFVRRNRIRHPGLVAAGRYELVGMGLRRLVDSTPPPVAEDALSAAYGSVLTIGGEAVTIGGEPVLATSYVGGQAPLARSSS